MTDTLSRTLSFRVTIEAKRVKELTEEQIEKELSEAKSIIQREVAELYRRLSEEYRFKTSVDHLYLY